MINKSEFEKWLTDNLNADEMSTVDRALAMLAWSSCEQMYENRRCENCNNYHEGNCITTSCIHSPYATEEDKWEIKK